MLDNQSLIVINNDTIIKILKQDEFYYYGYDLITEEFKKVFKHNSIPISNILIKLMNCEETRLKLAMNLTINEKDTAKLLNLSLRQINRHKNKYKLVGIK